MSINKVIIIGHLGQNPELKYTPSGAAVCNFSVATSETWTGKDGQKQEKTEWHRIIVWNKQAENCHRYIFKGSQVYIEGSLETRSWEPKDGGEKRYTTEIKARQVQFLTKNQQQTNTVVEEKISSTEQAESAQGTNFTEDDIPF